jgi:hypothetical protein
MLNWPSSDAGGDDDGSRLDLAARLVSSAIPYAMAVLQRTIRLCSASLLSGDGRVETCDTESPSMIRNRPPSIAVRCQSDSVVPLVESSPRERRRQARSFCMCVFRRPVTGGITDSMR